MHGSESHNIKQKWPKMEEFSPFLDVNLSGTCLNCEEKRISPFFLQKIDNLEPHARKLELFLIKQYCIIVNWDINRTPNRSAFHHYQQLLNTNSILQPIIYLLWVYDFVRLRNWGNIYISDLRIGGTIKYNNCSKESRVIQNKSGWYSHLLQQTTEPRLSLLTNCSFK